MRRRTALYIDATLFSARDAFIRTNRRAIAMMFVRLKAIRSRYMVI